MVPTQTSQLGRIAHCDILIMVVFRIPLFQEMQLKTLSDIKTVAIYLLTF